MLEVMSSAGSAERLNKGGYSMPTCSKPVPMAKRNSLKFENYLFAASPPGFEVMRLHSSSSNENRFNSISGDQITNNSSIFEKKTDDKLGFYTDARVQTSRDRTLDVERLLAWEQSYVCDYNAIDGLVCNCPASQNNEINLSKKLQVRFADEVGLTLINVRELTESSDTPPTLLNCSAIDDSGHTQPEFRIGFNLVLNFTQPAANYYEFRQKLEQNWVSLENVIARNRTLFGTVRVRNTPFEKSVVVRITYDSWKSFSDVQSKFVDGFKSSMGQYDTFSFTVDVPIKCEDKIQFAVCYKAGNQEFWDSNNGLNYQIINAASSDCSSSTVIDVFLQFDSHNVEPEAFRGGVGDVLDTPYW